MEFYQAASALLPDTHYVSPDVGTVFGSYCDFWVDNGLSWAIELMRESSALVAHEARFEQSGLYAPIERAAQEYNFP